MRLHGVVRFLLAAATMALLLPSTAGAYQEFDNQVATSFDDTKIVYKLFLPDDASPQSPVPVVLRTHGWGGSRETSAAGFVKQLLDSGYGVLTWDQRGFGQSGGEVQVDDPDYEARDVSALIDVLANDSRVAQEAPGDPRIGMSGGSYAGGIQFVTAATDQRVDAIAPEIAWNNLLESLLPDGVVKIGWDLALYGAGQTAVTGGLVPGNPAGTQTGAYNPQIHKALAEGASTGTFSAETQAFFAEKGPDFLLGDIQAPTFIIQATTDMLFPPSQAIDNWETYQQQNATVPLKMAWYCGGHGSCGPFSSGPGGHTSNNIVNWFDRHVKGDSAVDTGAAFEYLTNDGVWHTAADYPVPGANASWTGTGSGVLTVNGEPVGSGFMQGAQALTAVEVPIQHGGGTVIGEPTVQVTLTGNGTGVGGDETMRAPLFFQLVNKTKNEVIGNQVTPRVVDTDGQEHTYEFELEGVAYTAGAGENLVLEVAANSAFYEPYHGAAVIELKDIDVSIPAIG